MFTTPFSGLSLIVHLGMIAYGKLMDFLRSRYPISSARVFKKWSVFSHAWFKYTFSILILLVLLVVTSLMFLLAIRTSMREGEGEWLREYVEAGLSVTGEYVTTNMTLVKSRVTDKIPDNSWDAIRPEFNNYTINLAN